MEGSFSTGQSPQWAVVPVEEEEECYANKVEDMCRLQDKSVWMVGFTE
jgi:hypothetical protein